MRFVSGIVMLDVPLDVAVTAGTSLAGLSAALYSCRAGALADSGSNVSLHAPKNSAAAAAASAILRFCVMISSPRLWVAIGAVLPVERIVVLVERDREVDVAPEQAA